MVTEYDGNSFAPINPPGGAGGTVIPVNYELTATAGPDSDGVVYSMIAAKAGTFIKLGYTMETQAAVATVVSITDGIETVTATIPITTSTGVANLSASIAVAVGDTLKLTITSGSGGVPSALYLQ